MMFSEKVRLEYKRTVCWVVVNSSQYLCNNSSLKTSKLFSTFEVLHQDDTKNDDGQEKQQFSFIETPKKNINMAGRKVRLIYYK